MSKLCMEYIKNIEIINFLMDMNFKVYRDCF